MRTYIVVAVLDQKGNPLTCQVVCASGRPELFLCNSNIVEQASISEAPAGR